MKIAGIAVHVDPTIPADTIYFVQGGKYVGVIRNVGAQSPSMLDAQTIPPEPPMPPKKAQDETTKEDAASRLSRRTGGQLVYDAELQAKSTCFEALAALSLPAKVRVVDWLEKRCREEEYEAQRANEERYLARKREEEISRASNRIGVAAPYGVSRMEQMAREAAGMGAGTGFFDRSLVPEAQAAFEKGEPGIPAEFLPGDLLREREPVHQMVGSERDTAAY